MIARAFPTSAAALFLAVVAARCGSQTEAPPSVCASVTCSDHGTCVEGGTGPVCLCDDGFRAEGPTCVAAPPVDPCAGVTCGGHGLCALAQEKALCVCDAGFEGEGADCTPIGAETSPCDGVTCGDHGACVVTGAGKPLCFCDPGYQPDGTSCTALVGPASPCDGVTCDDHGACIETAAGQPLCVCDTGFAAQDTGCVPLETPTDACDGVTCSDHGACVPTTTGPACLCDKGFYWKGAECLENLDPNPCAGGGDCGANGACVVTADGPACLCMPGFVAQGAVCVPDENPCASVACSSVGVCVEVGGGPVCVCSAGFKPQGADCVADQDLCDGVTCSGHGACVVASKGAACLCDPGYAAFGIECQSVAACAAGERRCSPDGLGVQKCQVGNAGEAAWVDVATCPGSPCIDGACGEVLLASGMIGPEGGQIIAAPPEPIDGVAGAELVVPPEALGKTLDLTVSQAAGPAMPSGDVPAVSLQIEPSGTKFAVPVELTLTYDEAALDEAGWLGPEFLQAMTYDEAEGAWTPLPKVAADPAAHTLVTKIDGLSYKALVSPIVFPTATYDPKQYPGRPVLLVHGIQVESGAKAISDGLAGSTGTWGGLSPEDQNLLGQEPGEVPVYELRYYTANRIEASACALKAAIYKILAAHPGYQSTGVTLVAHSLGGLVARAYTTGMGFTQADDDALEVACPYSPSSAGIYRLLTFGTPHGGSGWASLIPGASSGSAKQMVPESDFLADLNTRPIEDLGADGPEYEAYIGKDDWVVSLEKGKLWPQIIAAISDKDAHLKFPDVELDKLEHEGSSYGIVNISKKDEKWHKPVYDAMCTASGACGQPPCVPACAATGACGPDGCGGQCGNCSGPASACGPAGQCVTVDSPPTGKILSPTSGATLSSAFSVHVQVSDNKSVAKLTVIVGSASGAQVFKESTYPATKEADYTTAVISTKAWPDGQYTIALWALDSDNPAVPLGTVTITYQAGACVPACGGKECGDDGCGGTCEPGCGGTETCGTDGLCKAGATGGCANGWCTIPAGSFIMGSPEDEPCRTSDEGPAHQVTITRSFLLKQTEVTQGEWQDVVGAGNNPSSFESCGMDCPVEMVNWHEAVVYCNILSAKEGLESCYTVQNCSGQIGQDLTCSISLKSKGLDCAGYRLPTEAEWEYAARAGTTTAYWSGGSIGLGGVEVCSGDAYGISLPEVGWYYWNSGSKTHPVAQLLANPWGLYDVHGNVWEWVFDSYGSSYYAIQNDAWADPLGPAGTSRVFRGGGYLSDARCARSANRTNSKCSGSSYLDPWDRRDYVGFRPARSLP